MNDMATEDTTVRPIQSGELDALLDLYKHLHNKDEPLPRPQVRAAWQEMLSNPRMHCLVVEHDSRLVSSCVLTIIPNLTRGARPYGLIENVVTHTDYRQRGLGTAVLRHALQTAWRANCYKVMLLTGRKDPAVHRFYEKNRLPGRRKDRIHRPAGAG